MEEFAAELRPAQVCDLGVRVQDRPALEAGPRWDLCHFSANPKSVID